SAGRIAGRAPDSGVEPSKRSAADIQAARDAYDESIAYLDSRIGQLFTDLEARGVLANTIVVVTADHGEEFGEHGLFYHGHSLYRAALDVPLLMSWPGHLPARTVVSRPVSLRNLGATLIELALPGDSFPG